MMDFLFLDSENCTKEQKEKKVRVVLPCISITQKSGLFRLNGVAVEKTGYKPADKISLAQDKADKQWYLVASEKGFLSRTLKKAKGANELVFQNVKAAQTVMADVKLADKTTVRFALAVEKQVVNGLELWAVITRRDLNQK